MSCYKACVHNRDTNIATAIRSETNKTRVVAHAHRCLVIYIYLLCCAR